MIDMKIDNIDNYVFFTFKTLPICCKIASLLQALTFIYILLFIYIKL